MAGGNCSSLPSALGGRIRIGAAMAKAEPGLGGDEMHRNMPKEKAATRGTESAYAECLRKAREAKREGRLTEALELSGRAATLQPSRPGGFRMQSRLLWKMERYWPALQALDRGRQLESWLRGQGWRLGQKSVLSALDAAVHEDPEDALALALRSLARSLVSGTEAGGAEFEKAMEIRPDLCWLRDLIGPGIPYSGRRIAPHPFASCGDLFVCQELPGNALWQIVLCGVGISPKDHLTPETRDALRQCGNIFSAADDVATQFLRDEFPGSKVVGLRELWTPQNPDGEGSPDFLGGERAVHDEVLRSAMSGVRTALVTYGNPVLFSIGVASLAKECRRLGIPYKVLPAISSFDTVLARAGCCIIQGKINVVHAEENLDLRWMRGGTVNLFLSLDILVQRGKFAGFCHSLRQVFPAEARCFLVRTQGGPAGPEFNLAVAMEDLPAYGDRIDPRTSLLVVLDESASTEERKIQEPRSDLSKATLNVQR